MSISTKLTALAFLMAAGASFAQQTIGPIRIPGSTGITARANIGIKQADFVQKNTPVPIGDLPTNLCTVGDKRCATAIPAIPVICGAGQVNVGNSCVTTDSLVPSQAAPSGTTCGVHISYGGSAAPGSFWNGNSRMIASCNGYSVAKAYLDWYYTAESCTSDAGSCTPGDYSQRYFTAANCPPKYGYNILSSSDEAQTWTCYAD